MKKIPLIMLVVLFLLNNLGIGPVYAASSLVGVSYQSHVQNIGWQSSVSDGQVAGTEGQSLRMEALQINLTNAPAGARIKYEAHVFNIGWQSWVRDGQIAGTTGQSKQMEAIKITLENMPGYSVQYQVHVAGIGWQSWVTDGQLAGTTGISLKIEAIRIQLVKISDNSGIDVQYQSHDQNIGWQLPVYDGQVAGTEGLNLRMEALKINLINKPAGAGIQYTAHVAYIGWQSPVSDGQIAGTVGQSLRLEAIRISLLNMPAYSVQYQAFVSTLGWQPWVSDGQMAGTTGRSLRIEAIRIRIIDNTLFSVGETAVSAYENAPVTTLAEVTAAEALKAPAETAAASVVNATDREALITRISNRATTISAVKADLEESARQAVAETAITAYENAPVTTLVEVTTAESLKAVADTATAAVLDLAARLTFETRISNRATTISAVKAALEDATRQAAAETAVTAYENAPITTLVEVTTAEGLKAAADTATAAVLDLTARSIFEARISNRATTISEVKAALEDATRQAAAETAVTAYENAPITTLVEVTTAEGLKAAAVTATAAVLDLTARSTFEARIVNRAAAITAAKTALKVAEALMAVNSASNSTMSSVISTYSATLGLSAVTLNDYKVLSPTGQNNVFTSLVGKAFPNTAAVSVAFNIAVGVQFINETTVSATMESSIIRYAGILAFDSTAYTTYTFPTSVNPNAPSFKSRVNTTMIAGTFTSAANVKEAFDASVTAEAVRVIDIQVYNYMERDLRTFSVILGLNLTDFDTLKNKVPTLTAMVDEPFATKTHIKEFFDLLVINQKTIEAMPMLDAFNNAPDAATMGNVLAIYSTLFNAADYNTYINFIGSVEKVKVQTAMLAPIYTTEKDIQTSFIIGIMNNQYINYGKQVFANNIVLLGLATSTESNEYSLLSTAEKNLITNAVFAAKPIINQSGVVVAALNSATSESYIGTLITLNGATFGLDLTVYSTLPPAVKTIINQWLIAATMNNVAAVQTEFAAAMSSISNTLSVGGATANEYTNTFTYTLTTGTFDTTEGIDPTNWVLGGTNVADFGTITNIVLSNGNTIATVDITGSLYTSAFLGDYTVAPGQAAFSIGFTAPAEVPVIVLMQAEGLAEATTGTSIITYNLVGIFDPTQGLVTANWILGGDDVVDLGNVTNVVLSNGDTTATLTISGIIGTNPKDYTVAPAQAIFTPVVFAAPGATPVVITP